MDGNEIRPLLVTERHDRVDARGAERRRKTRHQSDAESPG
jgi:hypothetical protein